MNWTTFRKWAKENNYKVTRMELVNSLLGEDNEIYTEKC